MTIRPPGQLKEQPSARRREVSARELTCLGEIGFALLTRKSTAGAHLDDHRAIELGAGEVLEEFGGRLVAPARNEVLVASRAGAVGEVHVAQPTCEDKHTV